MNLLLYFEFTDETETMQATFADLRGIPIPTIGDCVCPGKGDYRILNRTFSYDSSGLTIYFDCEPVP
jgi:hypothetical protein